MRRQIEFDQMEGLIPIRFQEETKALGLWDGSLAACSLQATAPSHVNTREPERQAMNRLKQHCLPESTGIYRNPRESTRLCARKVFTRRLGAFVDEIFPITFRGFLAKSGRFQKFSRLRDLLHDRRAKKSN